MIWPELFYNLAAWLSNYIHYKIWDQITYPFQWRLEIWELMNNSISQFTWHVCLDHMTIMYIINAEKNHFTSLYLYFHLAAVSIS